MSAGASVRRCVVIGGASGIGRAIAEAFATRGDEVVVADLNVEGARAVAEEIGSNAAYGQVDVTDEQSVSDLFTKVTKDGAPSVVVNTAGINLLGAVTDQSVEDWRKVHEISLVGAFIVIKHAARAMERDGSIVTISSLNGKQAATGMSAYCSAKAGVDMLTQAAALDLGPKGIRVNAVAPGLIETPLVAPIFALPGMADEFLDNTPLGRVGATGDIASAVLFLCEPGSWITGETLAVDGGARMRRYPALYESIVAATQASPQ